MNSFHAWPVVTVQNFGKEAARALQHQLGGYLDPHPREIAAQVLTCHHRP